MLILILLLLTISIVIISDDDDDVDDGICQHITVIDGIKHNRIQSMHSFIKHDALSIHSSSNISQPRYFSLKLQSYYHY